MSPKAHVTTIYIKTQLTDVFSKSILWETWFPSWVQRRAREENLELGQRRATQEGAAVNQAGILSRVILDGCFQDPQAIIASRLGDDSLGDDGCDLVYLN